MTTFNASSRSELDKALDDARGGDKIVLESGNYGLLYMKGTQDPHFKFSSNVTITSEDPNSPAVFTDVRVSDVSNLTLEGIKFDFVNDKETSASNPAFMIDRSSHITIRDAIFDGATGKGSSPIENGFPTGFGLRLQTSSDVTVEDSEFFNFLKAANFREIDGLSVKNNEVHSIRGDGFVFASVKNAVIEDNYIHDFTAHPDDKFHRDMIQFLTLNTDFPSEDVTIRNNVLNSGEGRFTQSIWINNLEVTRGGAGNSMYYKNLTIEDNIIYNSHVHGIAVYAADGLSIKNNTLLHNTADRDVSGHIPQIIVKQSKNVDISKNIADDVRTIESSNVKTSDNLLVQRVDPLAEGYYGNIFVSANRPGAPIEALQALPDSVLSKLGVGATATGFNSKPDGLVALARHEVDKSTHIFDGSYSAGPGGAVGDAGTYSWDFGDGKSAKGKVVEHTYDDAGYYNVTLTVNHGGNSDDFKFAVRATDPLLLGIRATSSGLDDISAFDAEILQEGKKAALSGGALQVTDSNAYSVDRFDTVHLHALDEFTLSFDMQRDGATAATAGRMMELRNAWRVMQEKDGRIGFTVQTDEGKSYKLSSDKAIADTGWHSVDIHFDGEDGKATMWIDGAVAGSVAVAGLIPSYSNWGPVIGNPWGSAYNGKLKNIDMYESAEAAGLKVDGSSSSGGSVPNGGISSASSSSGSGSIAAAELWIVDATSNTRLAKLSDGASIDAGKLSKGEYSIEAVSGADVASVRFKLGDVTQVENTKPYAAFGDVGGDFRGASLPSGPQSVTAEFFSGANASGSKLGMLDYDFQFTGATSPYALAVSGSSNRSGASGLDGASLDGDVFIFTTGTQGADQVRFYLDDEAASGRPIQFENTHWHDFAGSTSNGNAKAWDTAELRDGTHTITAEIFDDGARTLLSDSFVIDNA